MKKFIKKTSLFIIGAPLIYIIFYIGLDYCYNNKRDKNAIYIWGDSQTYRGIDLNIIKNKTTNKVYSYTKHGAGVYDFLIFSKKVPKNSTIILGVSKPVQLRKKQSDRNMSGISINALLTLYENGYTFQELETIIRKNKKPSKILQRNTNMYDYADTIVLGEPIALFEEIYKEIPSYLAAKQNLYKIGIANLRKKQCNIVFIDFPYHSLLKNIENKSEIKFETEKFSKHIVNSSKKILIDTLVLDTKKEVMHDLTHLNEFGARQVSDYVSSSFNKYERTSMYIENCRDGSNINNCSRFEVFINILN